MLFYHLPLFGQGVHFNPPPALVAIFFVAVALVLAAVPILLTWACQLYNGPAKDPARKTPPSPAQRPAGAPEAAIPIGPVSTRHDDVRTEAAPAEEDSGVPVPGVLKACLMAAILVVVTGLLFWTIVVPYLATAVLYSLVLPTTWGRAFALAAIFWLSLVLHCPLVVAVVETALRVAGVR